MYNHKLLKIKYLILSSLLFAGSVTADNYSNLSKNLYWSPNPIASNFDAVKKAAEEGYVMAQFNLGYMYWYGIGATKNYSKAAHWYRLAAEQGHARAQSKLGIMYAGGKGVEKNDEKAMYYLLKGAEQGEPGGQYYLGYKYRHGIGVPEDDEKAVSWYRKAAEQGAAAAQHELGLMYCLGEGIPTNYVQCYAWLNLSAAQGDEQSRKAKDSAISLMTTDQIAEAQKLSGKYWELYGPSIRNE